MTTATDKQITAIGNYIYERSAFKARKIGTTIVIYSYVNVHTAVPAGTQFADTGFQYAEGYFLFIQEDGTKPSLISCSSGKMRAMTQLQAGYYYCIGAALTVL